MKRICTLLFLLCLLPLISSAEGTRETAPNSSIVVNNIPTTDVAALLIDHAAYGGFATLNTSTESSRLFINIQNPATECIYLGFSYGHLNLSTPSPPPLNFSFVIKDPNGNVVYGPHLVTRDNANINGWKQAYTGPQAFGGAEGYIPITISQSELQSTGWQGKGDYYIEFDAGTRGAGFLIDFWDITVVDCAQEEPIEKKGRLWSYNWALFAINDYGFPHRPFNGAFYTCSPDGDNKDNWFISKIDFDQSGFKPAAFNIAFNSFGTRNTGDIAYDRRSVENQNLTNPEYPIFLNDPVDVLQTAEIGEIEFISLQSTTSDAFCIRAIPTKSGQIDVLVDLDGPDGVFKENTRDLLLSMEIKDSMIGQEICIPWNGYDGLGEVVTEDSISLTLYFSQGIYHFPIYDAELMENGFTLTNVRPAGPTPLLYYDDSEISLSSGTGEPQVNLNGCELPCHSWTTYIDPNFPGYGNLNTINSWWFSNSSEISHRVGMPNLLQCNLAMLMDLCRPRMDTIYSNVSIIGPEDYTIIEFQWLGLHIIESHQDYAIVEKSGDYSFHLQYINNKGDTLITSCTINTTQVACPDNTQSIEVSCLDEIPDPLLSLEDFLAAGYQLGDTSCLNLSSSYTDTDNGASGCGQDSMIIIREYTIFHDMNNNDILDDDESYIQCRQTFILLDKSTSDFHFTHPDLKGKSSGDTLRIQCKASELDWEMPQYVKEDLAYANDCSDTELHFSIQKSEDGKCSELGFITRYTYQWDIQSRCKDTSIFFIVEMVDTLSPEFISGARDTAIYCTDLAMLSPPLFKDECCCASLDYTDESIGCISGLPTILRRWILSDACGNTTELQERIKLIDTGELVLQFLPLEISDGEIIEVSCHNGAFPPEIRQWNENSVIASGTCTEIDIQFQRERLKSDGCEDNVAGKWKFSWIATDLCNNSKAFTVLIDILDTEAPVFTRIPENNCTGFPALDDYEVIENCSKAEVQVIVEDIVDNKCPDLIQKRYEYIATDNCGNTSRVSRIFSQGRTEAPSISLVNVVPDTDMSITLDCDTDKVYPLLYSRDAVKVTTHCTELKDLFFKAETQQSGTCNNGVYKIDILRWIAVDGCNNSSELILTVRYRDTEAPRIANFRDVVYVSCPLEIPVYTEFYDCNEVQVISDVLDYIENCNESSQAQRTIVIEDICGNKNSYSQTVYLDRSESITILNAEPIICESDKMEPPMLYDLCYDTLIHAQLVGTEKLENCNEYFNAVQVWSLKDICGSEKRIYRKLMRDDIPAPIINISHPELGDLSGLDRLRVNCDFEGLREEHFSIENNCGAYKTVFNKLTISDYCIDQVNKVIEYSYTASDYCGNTYTRIIDVEFMDTEAPVIENIPEDMTISCINDLPDATLTAWDNCSEVDITMTELPVTNTGRPGITRIWQVRDACLNTSVAMQVIEIENKLNCYIDIPDNIDCWSSTEIEVVVAGGDAPYTYKWETIAGECLISQSTNTPRARVTILSDSAEVKVTVIDDNGCETECTVIIYCDGMDSLTGERNADSSFSAYANEVVVYPNPTSGEFYVRSVESIDQLKLYSVSGQLLKSISSEDNHIQVSHDLVPGLYYLEIYTTGGISYQKLVVE